MPVPVQTTENSSSSAGKRHDAVRGPFVWNCAAVFLALLFALSGLRGAAGGAPIDYDAPRHALNGAMLRDLVAEGAILHPVDFARTYYSHFPALTIPYHPPLFPAVEAVFYQFFGVSYLTARLTVAFTVALTFLLLYILGRRLTGSEFTALAAAAFFFLLPLTRLMTGEVMLEMPSLALVIVSLLLLHKALDTGPPFRGLIGFGIAAAATVWTKQTAMFVIGVPVVALFAKYRLLPLKHWRVWVGLAISSAASVLMIALMKVAGASSNTTWDYEPLPRMALHHADFYFRIVWDNFTAAGTLLLIAGLLWYGYQRLRAGHWLPTDLAVAAIAMNVALVLVLPPADGRYLLPAFPMAILLAMWSVSDWASRFHIPAIALRAATAAVFGVIFAATSLAAPPTLTGIPEAAQMVASREPDRVLVCADHNGPIVFEFRVHQPSRKTFVLRGHGLPAATFEPAAFGKFLHDYGIEYVLMEDTIKPEPYDGLKADAVDGLQFERAFRVDGDRNSTGVIRVYRFLHPSASPAKRFRALSAIGTSEREVILDRTDQKNEH